MISQKMNLKVPTVDYLRFMLTLAIFILHVEFLKKIHLTVSCNKLISKDLPVLNKNSPAEGSRSAEFALEIFKLVKSRHLLLYVTTIAILNSA